MVNEHFICLAAASNIFVIYWETHKILLIHMASICAQLSMWKQRISSNSVWKLEIKSPISKMTHRQVFLYIPQSQCAVSGCRSKFIVRQEFHIWNSFPMPTKDMQWLADISQVIIMNVMICRANLQNYQVDYTKLCVLIWLNDMFSITLGSGKGYTYTSFV